MRCRLIRQFDVCAGLPVSTTQTITGALLSIGLMEGFKGVNWRSVLRVRASCSGSIVQCQLCAAAGMDISKSVYLWLKFATTLVAQPPCCPQSLVQARAVVRR